jgi:hypothetical protein
MWLQPNLTSASMIGLLADLDRLFERPDCVLVKDQKKIKVGRVPLETSETKIGVYIKRYNAFSWRYRIQSYFSHSGASRALRGAAILWEAQIKTAKPLAAVEVRHWGMLNKSFYLSEEITAAKTADAYWRENLKTARGVTGFHARRRFLTDLSRLFRRLHGERIYHNDLKDFNILVREDESGNEEFFVLDLEGVRRCCYLSMRRRIKNLTQLNRTLGRFLSRTEKLCFLKSYLQNGRLSRDMQARWVKNILIGSQKADRLSFAKSRVLRKSASG